MKAESTNLSSNRLQIAIEPHIIEHFEYIKNCARQSESFLTGNFTLHTHLKNALLSCLARRYTTYYMLYIVLIVWITSSLRNLYARKKEEDCYKLILEHSLQTLDNSRKWYIKMHKNCRFWIIKFSSLTRRPGYIPRPTT